MTGAENFLSRTRSWQGALLPARGSASVQLAGQRVRPLPESSPLWHVDNVVLTPHVTSDDLDAYLPKTFDLVFANAARLMSGETLINVVDPARGY